MSDTANSDCSKILEQGKTPARWVEVMSGMGIDISERTLRERANDTGAFYRLGRTMLITPAQIDKIFEGGQACRSKSTRGVASPMKIHIVVGQGSAGAGGWIKAVSLKIAYFKPSEKLTRTAERASGEVTSKALR